MFFSKKSFLLSFVAAFALFSIVMACICADIFRSRQEPIMIERVGANGQTINREMLETHLLLCLDKTGEQLSFAVLVRVDRAGRRLLMSPADGNYLIGHGGTDELFYLRSIYEIGGGRELADALGGVTGYFADEKNISDLRQALPSSMMGTSFDYDEISHLLTYAIEDTGGYSLEECPFRLVSDDTDIAVIDAEATLAAFQNGEKS